MNEPEAQLSNDAIQQSIADDARKQQLVETVTLPANLPDKAETSTASDAVGDVLASAASSGLDVVVDAAAGTLTVVGEFLGGFFSA